MSAWNKQNWIKDILSKSGTEITEINEDKMDEGLFNFKIVDLKHILWRKKKIYK